MGEDDTGNWDVHPDCESVWSDNEHFHDLATGDDLSDDDDLMHDLPFDLGDHRIPLPQPVPRSATALTSTQPTSATLSENDYLIAVQRKSGLHLTMETTVRSEFGKKDGAFGLFALFVTASLRKSIRGWTSIKLESSEWV
ncbi:hypothetical protein ON010_g16853 [Phytophthora cinnamomi]|nr:hypothetical protein ON010_g16853 [Phytophthora cinnamomi]